LSDITEVEVDVDEADIKLSFLLSELLAESSTPKDASIGCVNRVGEDDTDEADPDRLSILRIELPMANESIA
jgi:hypothetical protein